MYRYFPHKDRLQYYYCIISAQLVRNEIALRFPSGMMQVRCSTGGEIFRFIDV